MNIVQTTIFDTHNIENNQESQKNLDENRDHFNNKCFIVFNWLMSGKEITALWAANEGVSSLPRRILDLKQNGVLVSDRWSNKVKVWHMTEEQKLFNQKFIK
jgi:hypothetical protein